MLSAVFRQLVKDYRTSVRRCRELEQSIKAEKYKMARCGSVYMCSLTFVHQSFAAHFLLFMLLHEMYLTNALVISHFFVSIVL